MPALLVGPHQYEGMAKNNGIDTTVMDKLINSQLDNMSLINFNDICEQREIDMLQHIILQYNNLLRYLFDKYQGSSGASTLGV